MTKERELLRRALEAWETDDGYEDLSVFDEIRTYLAAEEGKKDIVAELVEALEELMYARTDKAESMAEAALAKARGEG